MWFKNLIIYRFTRPFEHDLQALEAALQGSAFTPCRSQELVQYGWVPPMGKYSDQLVHSGNGYLMLCTKKQEKILPASVIKELVDEKAALIEEEQARKVRKKERDALKEEVLLELTPKAFSRYQQTYACICPREGWLLVDASSPKRAEDLCSHLRKALGSLPVVIPALKQAPASVMTDWLRGERHLETGFELGDECELRDTGEEGGVVRCRKQNLEGEEINVHLDAGKQAVKLALTYQEKLSFLLSDDLSLKRLKFSDELLDKAAENGADDPASRFDADFCLMMLELGNFIPALLENIGGEDEQAYASAIQASA